MNLAIHDSITGFHTKWIVYCKSKKIPHKLVDCYSNQFIDDLKDCDVLMWHPHQGNYKDNLIAKQILFSLEHTGVKVFPDFATAWHFDDKLAQKYLFEALNIPHVKTYAFYEKSIAFEWIKTTSFPKVFKLRRGAGSANVKLVRDSSEAFWLTKRAFGMGFENFDRIGTFKERLRKYRLGKVGLVEIFKGIYRFFDPPFFSKVLGRERGYILFQDFIPDNDHDIRVIVIGDKAFAIKRMVRENDFRASGSGFIRYEKENFSDEIISLSFKINKKIQSQSLAIDYVFNNGKPLVVEISYGFSPEGYDPCVGYWDDKLNFYPSKFDPYGWMIENLLNS